MGVEVEGDERLEVDVLLDEERLPDMRRDEDRVEVRTDGQFCVRQTLSAVSQRQRERLKRRTEP